MSTQGHTYQAQTATTWLLKYSGFKIQSQDQIFQLSVPICTHGFLDKIYLSKVYRPVGRGEVKSVRGRCEVCPP